MFTIEQKLINVYNNLQCFMLSAQAHIVHWIGHVCNFMKKIYFGEKQVDIFFLCPEKNKNTWEKFFD